jgi:hypothetical protein
LSTRAAPYSKLYRLEYPIVGASTEVPIKDEPSRPVSSGKATFMAPVLQNVIHIVIHIQFDLSMSSLLHGDDTIASLPYRTLMPREDNVTRRISPKIARDRTMMDEFAGMA